MSLPLSSRPPGPTAVNLALLRFLLGGVGNDYAASGLRLGIDSLDDNAVVKRSEFHWCPPAVLSKVWHIYKADRVSKAVRCLKFRDFLVRNQLTLLDALDEPVLIAPAASVAMS
jgi:hypothetical protein